MLNIGRMLKKWRYGEEAPLVLTPSPEMDAQYQQFWEKGYIVVRGMFSPEEMQIIKDVIMTNDRMNARLGELQEAIRKQKHPSFETIFVCNDTSGNDVFSKATRNHRIIDRLEYFFRDHIYVYHNKVTLKYPGIVGFRYHQDYHYWYQMGNCYPDMATAAIAIDPATRKNGCLKILEGSHKMGRMEHVTYGVASDSGVCSKRLKAIQPLLNEVHIELDAGDVVIFHSNALHASDTNRSADSRIALLGCYNTKHNSPHKSLDVLKSGHPRWRPQSKVYDPLTAEDAKRLPDFDLRY